MKHQHQRQRAGQRQLAEGALRARPPRRRGGPSGRGCSSTRRQRRAGPGRRLRVVIAGAMRAVTRATRRWSRRKISRAPSTGTKPATSPSVTRAPPPEPAGARPARRAAPQGGAAPRLLLVAGRHAPSTRAPVERGLEHRGRPRRGRPRGRPRRRGRAPPAAPAGPPSNEERTFHSSGRAAQLGRHRLGAGRAAPRAPAPRSRPSPAGRRGRARGPAPRPDLPSASSPGMPPTAGAAAAHQLPAGGPPAASRTGSGAPCSPRSSSSRITRSSSGIRPISDSIGRTSSPPASRISSTDRDRARRRRHRCPAGPTSRTASGAGRPAAAARVPKRPAPRSPARTPRPPLASSTFPAGAAAAPPYARSARIPGSSGATRFRGRSQAASAGTTGPRRSERDQQRDDDGERQPARPAAPPGR